MAYTKSTTLPDDSLLMEEVMGQIGRAAMDQYFIYAKMQYEVPKTADIVKDPAGCRVPSDAAVQMLTVYNLAAEVTPEIAGAAITYIERLPKDFAVTFANSAYKRKPTLALTPVFKEWVRKNSALLFLVNQMGT
jgi:hypothetical protein